MKAERDNFSNRNYPQLPTCARLKLCDSDVRHEHYTDAYRICDKIPFPNNWVHNTDAGYGWVLLRAE